MAAPDEQPAHLMVSGRYGSREIHRGMLVVDESGRAVAIIAGIALDEDDETATHLLLGRLPPTGDYRLAPIGRVAAIETERICLRLEPGGWNELPRHETE